MLSYWSKRNRVNGRLIATACEVGLSSSGICGFPHDDNRVSREESGSERRRGSFRVTRDPGTTLFVIG